MASEINWDEILNELLSKANTLAESKKIAKEGREKMPRIKIVSTPELPGIHEKIREGWIGVELEAKGPYEHYGGRKVYEVPVSVALEALKKNDEMAWRWFFYAFLFMRTPVFFFPVECCEEVSSNE